MISLASRDSANGPMPKKQCSAEIFWPINRRCWRCATGRRRSSTCWIGWACRSIVPQRVSVICTGGAASRCYQAGVNLGNPEMVQVHPTAIPGEDKCRLISESARGEGGRVWVPRKAGDTRNPNAIPEEERYYFLEEKYPKYGNIVPRDIATREIFQVCQDGLGVGGGNMVYLDLRDEVKKRGRAAILNKLEGILEIYEKFVGTDPLDEPMKIFPAVHYSMGGLWVGFGKNPKTGGLKFGDPANTMTNIPGL